MHFDTQVAEPGQSPGGRAALFSEDELLNFSEKGGRTRQESELGLPRVDSGIVGDTDIATRATPFVVRFSTGEEPDNTAGSCPAGQQEAVKPSFDTAADERAGGRAQSKPR